MTLKGKPDRTSSVGAIVIPPDQLGGRLAKFLAQGRPQEVAGRRAREALAEARNLAQLDACAEDREQQGVAEDADQMTEAGGPGRVRAGHPISEAQAQSPGWPRRGLDLVIPAARERQSTASEPHVATAGV